MDDDLTAQNLMLIQFLLQRRGLADQDDLKLIEVISRHDGSFDHDLWGVIPPHAIQGDPDHKGYSFSWVLTLIDLTSFPL
jgi:hypothetical protein